MTPAPIIETMEDAIRVDFPDGMPIPFRDSADCGYYWNEAYGFPTAGTVAQVNDFKVYVIMTGTYIFIGKQY